MNVLTVENDQLNRKLGDQQAPGSGCIRLMHIRVPPPDPQSGQDRPTGHATGRATEFRAGAVDGLTDGRLAPPGARAALVSATQSVARVD